MESTFKGKILLVGEYTVIDGGDALLMPSDQYYGRLAQSDEPKLDLKPFVQFIHSHHENDFDIIGLRQDLASGLYFDSNIPLGYGLGSSGALTAAIYEKYCTNKRNSHQGLQQDLATLEGFFSW